MKILLGVLLFASIATAQPHKTKNVILITADGLRWQELFTGIDPALMDQKATHMKDKDGESRRKLYWRDTPEERRVALMPFFWGEIANRGVIYGNVTKGSSVQVTNAQRVSYPGYSEILTGQAQDDVITGNVDIQNPSETVLEFLRRRLELTQKDVALFSSWEHFTWIGESKPGTVTISAGRLAPDALPAMRDARHAELLRAQLQARTPWGDTRHDYFTFELGMEYWKAVHPRMMFISLDETDDWSHDRRYDLVLDAIAYFDSALKQLFESIDRSNTTVIIACDHGRGSSIIDWDGHGEKIAGAEQIWIAIVGPDTPALGEATNVPDLFQRDITPTILDLLGIAPSEMPGVLGRPIKPLSKVE